MQEKADFDVAFAVTELFAQELRQKHQVVVMDPDTVVVPDMRRYFFGKESVCRLVSHSGGVI